MKKIIKYCINIGYCILAFASLGILKNILAKHVSIKSEKKLSGVTHKKKYYFGLKSPKYNLTVVMFYRLNKKLRKEDKQQYLDMKDFLKMFKDLNNAFSKRSGLTFASVNLEKSKNAGLEKEYAVKLVPYFVLLLDGSVYKDSAGRIQALTGFTDRNVLIDFIKKNFDTYIEENIKQSEKIRSMRSYYYDYYWPYYYGWPGYPYYYGGPYYRYGYPYYGGRPGFYFGFGI